jgi:hypothetical protein
MIVLLATAWGSASGGINAFNFGLARGLGTYKAGSVACAVIKSTPRQKASTIDGVFVLPIEGEEGTDRLTPDCGEQVVAALTKLGITVAISHWVGHDLITGDAALRCAERQGGEAVVIHHMRYLRYQNFGGGRGDDATLNHERQIELFSQVKLAFGVGIRLAESAKQLGATRSEILIPGFPDLKGDFARDHRDLCMIAAGRFDSKSEPLKRIMPVAAGFGRAVRDSRRFIPTLHAPTLTVLGADAGRQVELEAVARKEAGSPVNIVPSKFNPNPAAVVQHLRSSNLAILPSRHEGFGLIGWEAIGTATPLILGANTGLATQLTETLDVGLDGLVHMIDFTGADEDIDAIALAIKQVSLDLPRALRKATVLRDQLKSELGCSWIDTARAFLIGIGEVHPAPIRKGTGARYNPTCVNQNNFLDCVELSVSTGQGITPHSVEIIAELRFGTTELDVEGIEAEIGLTRARLRVSPAAGHIEGARLGDETHPIEGLEARAGGIWLMTAPPGRRLPNKALGDETLCRIEAPEGVSVSARVEVTAAKRDLSCDVRVPGRRLKNTTHKVLGIFLKNAVMDDDSGHIHFSSAQLGEPDDAE